METTNFTEDTNGMRGGAGMEDAEAVEIGEWGVDEIEAT